MEMQKQIQTEKEIYDFILSCCDANEVVDSSGRSFQEYLGMARPTFYPDLFLPKGCKLLGFPHNTIIEIKYRLKSNSIYNIWNNINAFVDKLRDGTLTLIVVYNEQNNADFLKITNGLHGRVKLYSLSELQEKVKNSPCNPKRMSFDDIKGRAAKQFAEGPVSFFLGAGVSCSANLPKWEDLLKSLLDYPAIKEGTMFINNYRTIYSETI